MKPTRESYLELIDTIREHDFRYYIQSSPSISDFEYDLLLKKLEEIEKQHPDWVSPTSPTQRSGDALLGGFKQALHAIPMLSLANTYSQEELNDFNERIEKILGRKASGFSVELKMDGVAISVRYENGVFVRGLTRGDGRNGDEITANLRTIPTIPLKLHTSSPPEVLEIRGEIFMRHSIFQRANLLREEMGDEPWANPRNAAAGSLKLLDPKEVRKRRLSALFYAVAIDSSGSVHSQCASHQFLRELGLPAFSPDHICLCGSMREVLDFAEKIRSERSSFDFDIDGIVVKVDDLALYDLLGTTAKSPRWAVAYKFAPEQAETRIRDISLQVGRTGVLTPVAELEPVFLAGSRIARATLHNQEEIDRKDIRVGDFVMIEKGGDVIPKVVHVVLAKRPLSTALWKMPTHCPVCSTALVHIADEVAVRCPNPLCKEQVLRRIAFFASKGAMDIEHLGPKIVQQLVEMGFVETYADLYALTEKELAQLEGFKERSIYNLMTSIEASKRPTLAQFIFALGVPFVGEGTAAVVASHASGVENLFSLSIVGLMKMEGVGARVAQSIYDFFQSEENQKEIRRLLSLGVEPRSETLSIAYPNHPIAGKTFVLTGTLQEFSREEAAQQIRQRGGRVSTSISQKTDFLVVGEEAGSKLDKAKKFHTAILDEESFKRLLIQ